MSSTLGHTTMRLNVGIEEKKKEAEFSKSSWAKRKRLPPSHLAEALISPFHAEPSSGWCMCGCATHFSNHLCIACLSGSVRWQPEQWWYHYSKHYTDLWSRGTPRIVKQQGKKYVRKSCSERFCHRGQMLFLLYFSFLCRENTLWSRQFEKLWASAKTQLWLVFVTVCLVLDCQNWVSLPLKIKSKTCWNSVTR